MASFEEIGRKIDREVERLQRYWDEEMGPKTEHRAAQALRKVSERLAEAAREIEARLERKAK